MHLQLPLCISEISLRFPDVLVSVWHFSTTEDKNSNLFLFHQDARDKLVFISRDNADRFRAYSIEMDLTHFIYLRICCRHYWKLGRVRRGGKTETPSLK